MKNRVRRLMAAAVTGAALLALPACNSIKETVGLGGGYELDIRQSGSVVAQVQSLYVIVSPSAEVDTLTRSEATLGKLLDENLMDQYTSFAQYQPLEGSAWRVVAHEAHTQVELELKGDTIHLEIDKKLTGGTVQYCVVVLALYSGKGFKCVKVPSTDLESKLEQVIEVSSTGLQMSDA